MSDIARLKITLDEVDPQVLRKIEVPLDIKLDKLHVVIQAAMGWEDYHLYEFRVGRSLAYGIPDPDWPETRTLPAKKASLADLLEHAKKTFAYVYDFGDDWMHTVKVEAISPAKTDTHYPRLIAAEGRCPPEDCGGPWGYADLKDAMADPKHENHANVVEWYGEMFDPAKIDQTAIAKDVERIASKLTRKKAPAKPKPKSANKP